MKFAGNNHVLFYRFIETFLIGTVQFQLKEPFKQMIAIKQVTTSVKFHKIVQIQFRSIKM